MNYTPTTTEITTTSYPFYPSEDGKLGIEVILIVASLPFVILIVGVLCSKNCGKRKLKNVRQNGTGIGDPEAFRPPSSFPSSYLAPTLQQEAYPHVGNKSQIVSTVQVYEDPPPPYSTIYPS